MFSFKSLFCSHTEAVISEKILGMAKSDPIEIHGYGSVRSHLKAISSQTFIQTIQCAKCTRIRHKVVRHDPVD